MRARECLQLVRVPRPGDERAAGKPLPAGRKAGLDGHRRRIRRGGFRTRKAAEKALARLRMPADPESVLTTREWPEQWREQRTG
jgi:Arm DNA-binding domain